MQKRTGEASLERAQAEILSEGRLADTGLSAEQDVFSAANEVERGVQLLVELAVDRPGMIPVETLERLRSTERRHLLAPGEVAGFALAPLEVAELLEDLDRTGLRLGGVDQPRFEGIA